MHIHGEGHRWRVIVAVRDSGFIIISPSSDSIIAMPTTLCVRLRASSLKNRLNEWILPVFSSRCISDAPVTWLLPVCERHRNVT